MSSRIALGPFDVFEPHGAGGMGVVWRAEARAQKLPVALKVLASPLARSTDSHARFAHEVAAVARLDHESVVRILDFGAIPSEVERVTEGRLVGGSPYLVMEWLPDGSMVEERNAPRSWSELRTTLLAVLDALAHAHARAVIHRDVKPSNLMRRSAGGVCLIDFGLAVVRDMDIDEEPQAAGATPAYAAPEQLLSSLRAEQGPWTDLYALGCTAFRFLSGGPPFCGRSVEDVVEAQLHETLPPLESRMPIPTGTDGWLSRLTHKDPFDRYRSAADAARALVALGDAEPGESTIGASRRRDDVATRTLSTLFSSKSEGASETAATPAPGPVDERPEPPISWRRPPVPRPPTRVLGAGLRLHGLRPVPMVGRERERDAAWRALIEAHHARGPRVIVLHGAAGVGKSRIAEWISQRASELGAATTWQATHAPVPGAADGVAGMVARHLGCIGWSRVEVVRRLHRRLLRELGDDTSIASVERVVSDGGARATAHETRLAARTLLSRASVGRPVLLWVDDAQWGAETLRFLLESLGSGDLRRAAVIATVRDEDLGERPIERALLAELMGRDGVRALEVGPLSEGVQTALVEQLVNLDAPDARALVARTAGNPLFAVHLVGDWIQRGVLRAGDRGLEVAAGRARELPDDIHGVWNARIGRLLDDVPPKARVEAERTLELAAIIGREVVPGELDAARRHAGLADVAGLLERMVAERLARSTDDGWSFVHAMLRESLARRSEELGHARDLHRACAAMLADRITTPRALDHERRAHHLESSGEVDPAIDALLAAAGERFDRGDWAELAQLLARAQTQLHAVGADERDPRHGDILDLQGQVALRELRLDDAERMGEALLAFGERTGHAMSSVHALSLLGHVAEWRGYADAARRFQARARELAHDAVTPAPTLLRQASLVIYAGGDLDEADALVEAASTLAEQQHDEMSQLGCAYTRGEILSQRGRHDEAIAAHRGAHEMARAMGSRTRLGTTLNGLGIALGRARRYAEAEAELVAAISHYDEVGASSLETRVDLAMVRVEANGDAPELPELAAEAHRVDLGRMVSRVEVARAFVDARNHDWESCARRVATVSADYRVRCWPSREQITFLLALAEKAESSGRSELAKTARALAAAQWRDTGIGGPLDPAIVGRARELPERVTR